MSLVSYRQTIAKRLVTELIQGRSQPRMKVLCGWGLGAWSPPAGFGAEPGKIFEG